MIQFSNIDGLRSRDGNRGGYRLESTSGDHNFFRVDPNNGCHRLNRQLKLEYNDRANFLSALNMNPQYEFDIVYQASDLREFRETVTLELTDTLTATKYIICRTVRPDCNRGKYFICYS